MKTNCKLLLCVQLRSNILSFVCRRQEGFFHLSDAPAIFTHRTDCSPRTYLHGESWVDENYLVITAVERMRITKKMLCSRSFEATVYPLEWLGISGVHNRLETGSLALIWLGLVCLCSVSSGGNFGLRAHIFVVRLGTDVALPGHYIRRTRVSGLILKNRAHLWANRLHSVDCPDPQTTALQSTYTNSSPAQSQSNYQGSSVPKCEHKICMEI